MKQVVLALALLLVVVMPAPAQEPDPAHRSGVTESYVIGVEDQLWVVVWGEKDLTLKVTVRPDGMITIPLVNDVFVVGLTTNEVRAKVEAALGEYVREPNVTVIVEQIRSYRVFFIGEVKRQGALNFYQPTRLLQGLSAAGGKTEFTNKILVLRRKGSGEERLTFDYEKLLDGKQENVILESGDTVVVK